MPTVKEVYWLAGLLEGEGSFGCPKTSGLVISMNLTDLDVITKAANLMGRKVYPPRIIEGRKPIYSVAVHGVKAAGWMMTLFSLMGERRQAKIRECLEEWKQRPGAGQKTRCRNGHEYTPENTYYFRRERNGGRLEKVCRTCKKAWIERSNAKRRERYKERKTIAA